MSDSLSLGYFRKMIENREEADKAYYKYKKREWYLRNKEKVKQQATEWRKNHPERWKEAQREWQRRQPDRVRAHARKQRLKSAFNISPEQYDEMFNQQQGTCAICEKPERTGKRLAVDHHHHTGQIRGLLCLRCNITLGFIEKVKSMRFKLRPFLRYLKKHQPTP